MTRLCLFDLDGTLLPIDSDHAFGEFLVRIGWVDAETFRVRNDAFYQDYLAGTLDHVAYIDFATAGWRDRAPAEIEAMRRRYMDEVISQQVLPTALALVRSHQQRGDLVAIVTATSEFVTGPIAQAFGVEHLLAVRLQRDAQGRCTGRIDGTPTFQGGKVVRVNEWLQGLGRRLNEFTAISVYSDSTNDLPLLDLATEPVATNPTPALEAIALQRGWRILHLFT
ncbi:MAG: HAD-IB family hydrolase [Burkholderiales bacterium]